MTTTSDDGTWVRTANLGPEQDEDDSERYVTVRLYRDNLLVQGVQYFIPPDEGTGRLRVDAHTWTAEEREAEALESVGVVALLRTRAAHDEDGDHDDAANTQANLCWPDGQAATWLEDM